jgi:ABC-type transport system substrate-binding protein
MSPFKRLYPIILTILLVTATLACGLSIPGFDRSPATVTPTAEVERSSPPDEDDPAKAVEPEESTPTPKSPEPAANNQQRLILAGGDPPTLDPHLSGDATSAEYVCEIFSGLMTYDPDLNLIPDLAETYEVSDDGLVYTFKLREAAQFQDGKPIRAEDFKWSFERACDPATHSQTADTYMGDIVGCRDKLQGKADEVEGVVVVDDLTLQLTIDEPKGFFLAKMTYPTAYVLDRENVEEGGADWFTKPNGSGPFVVDEYAPDEGAIVLIKNENYYRDPKPILERVIYLINAPINPIAGYEEGFDEETTYDAIQIGSDNLSSATDPNNPLSKEFVSANVLSVFYVGFNVNEPPFDEVEVRQAFNLALDKERLVKLVFQGAAPVANGIVPPNMPGYENPDLSDYEFDPERALALIGESSYGDVSELPEITLYVSGAGASAGPVVKAMVESYKANLGVEIQVEQAPWREFLDDLNNPNSSYQMYQLGWIADYPDPQNFLEVLFHSTSAQNHGHYSNPELDALLDKARRAQDSQERLALYQQAEQMILDDAAWIPIYFEVEYWLVKPYVQGFAIPPLRIPRLQYVSIAEH